MATECKGSTLLNLSSRRGKEVPHTLRRTSHTEAYASSTTPTLSIISFWQKAKSITYRQICKLPF